MEACGVPLSCCLSELQINTQCGYQVRKPDQSARLSNINNIGCIGKLTSFMVDNAILLGSVVGAFLLVQIFAITLALSLASEIPIVRRVSSLHTE